MSVRRIVVWIVLVLLAGCGSGGSDKRARALDDNNPAPPPGSGSGFVHFEGIWQGVVTPDATGTSSWAIALVNGWGEFRLLMDDAQLVGFPSRTDSQLVGTLSGYRSPGVTWSDGTQISRFTINGSIASDEFIDGQYAGPGNDSGTMAMAWVDGSRSTEIAFIAGTWALYDEQQNILATFDIDVRDDWEASISGARANGCTYSGLTESWTSFNSYDVPDLVIDGCPAVAGLDINGRYTGTAAHIDVDHDAFDGAVLVIGLSNDEHQLTYFLHQL